MNTSLGSGLLLPPPAKQPEDLVDMTSMVDIVFFLLIFFLVTSLQAMESTMEMPPPKSADGASARPADQGDHSDYIQVRIEDDDSIWVDDVQAFSDVDLRIRLKHAKGDGAHGDGVFLLGDADASHGAAVRVLDACADTNLPNVLFAIHDKEAEQ